MSYKKYLSDYRIEEYLDERGRVKKKAVYAGDSFEVTPELSDADKKLIIAASAVSWAAYIGAIAQTTEAARLAYIILPLTLTAFPLIFMTMAAVTLYRVKSVMTREEADKTAGRLPIHSFFAMFFPGAAFTALIVSLFFTDVSAAAGDMLFGVFSLVATLASALVFAKCRKMKPKIIEKNQQ